MGVVETHQEKDEETDKQRIIAETADECRIRVHSFQQHERFSSPRMSMAAM